MNDPRPDIFDVENAAWLCRASRDSYTVPARSDNTIIGDQQTETRVVISQLAGNDVIIAFRGTCDLRNWLTDLDCKYRSEPCGRKVHEGFATSLESVLPQLDDRLFAMQGEKKLLWITGHSLGGGLAMLFARHVQTASILRAAAVAGVYTFGQPRVGNGAFCEVYDALLKPRTFRVVHSDDVVARVPWLLGAYRHCGHEVTFYDRTRHNRYGVDLRFDEKLASDLPIALRELLHGKVALIADHHVDTYLALFANKEEKS